MGKSVTLELVGYRCRGESRINLWGGGQGSIVMKSWDIKELNDLNISKGINDGEFGCESIEYAVVEVYKLYEHGYEEFMNERGYITINSKWERV